MIICPVCKSPPLDEYKCNSYCHDNLHADVVYLDPLFIEGELTPQSLEHYQNIKAACCPFSYWKVDSFRIVTEVQLPSLAFPEAMKMKGLTDKDIVDHITLLVMYSSDIEEYKKGNYEFKV